MATLSTKWPTLMDLASRQDPGGMLADIAEIIVQQNPILDDMPWIEGNKPDGHVHTGRSSYATPTWRRVNQGVAASKSTTTQYTDVTGMLEMFTKIDCKLAKMSGNVGKFRADEERAQMEAMNEVIRTSSTGVKAMPQPARKNLPELRLDMLLMAAILERRIALTPVELVLITHQFI